jgi:NADH-ubiquinone oxidoreductase chain 2
MLLENPLLAFILHELTSALLVDGCPILITSWIAVVPKISILLFLVNLLPFFNLLFILVGIISLLVGSIGLGTQFRIKRFLAYSAISHLGFLMFAITFNDAYFFYLIIYTLTSLNLFIILCTGYDIRWATLSGLQNKGLALAIGLSFFSLAGIPPLAGFYAKFLVLSELIQVGWYSLTFLAILTSVLSTANYLRLIQFLSFDSMGQVIYLHYVSSIVLFHVPYSFLYRTYYIPFYSS